MERQHIYMKFRCNPKFPVGASTPETESKQICPLDPLLSLLKLAVADLGGTQPAPPPWPKIFSISCSFSRNLAKSYVGAPLEGWRPLLRGILDPPLVSLTNLKLKSSLTRAVENSIVSCQLACHTRKCKIPFFFKTKM